MWNLAALYFRMWILIPKLIITTLYLITGTAAVAFIRQVVNLFRGK